MISFYLFAKQKNRLRQISQDNQILQKVIQKKKKNIQKYFANTINK